MTHHSSHLYVHSISRFFTNMGDWVWTLASFQVSFHPPLPPQEDFYLKLLLLNLNIMNTVTCLNWLWMGVLFSHKDPLYIRTIASTNNKLLNKCSRKSHGKRKTNGWRTQGIVTGRVLTFCKYLITLRRRDRHQNWGTGELNKETAINFPSCFLRVKVEIICLLT